MGIFWLQKVIEIQSEKTSYKKRKIVLPFEMIDFFGNQ
jgi:hypothetical protein